MRDMNRINSFCERLAIAWKNVPDQRFGQLMCNILGDMQAKGRDPFFPEEKEMIEFIEEWCSARSIWDDE